MTPQVSILIDTFNYGRFIEAAIDSVLDQDFPREQMEIIVVDDGSTDDTAERVAKYGDRVRYLRKANGGQASAFNLGLAEVRGDIIAFLDADDYWLPGKLRGVVAEFEKQPEVGMVYHSFYKRDDSDGELRDAGFAGASGFLPGSKEGLRSYDLHPTSALSFRRSVMERLLPIPEGMVIQADAHLAACSIFLAPVTYLQEPLAVYRIHGENLWHIEREGGNRDRLYRRMLTTRAAGKSVRQWLQKNHIDVSRPHVQAFLMQWAILSRADEFALSPPGRLRFFAHLMQQGRYSRGRMTRRHKIVFYMNAFGSLLVGYRNFSRIEECRLAFKDWSRNALHFKKSHL